MIIYLNGEAKEIEKSVSISELLTMHGIKNSQIAVEQNLRIVPKSMYEQTLISDNDQIEIIRFMGGG